LAPTSVGIALKLLHEAKALQEYFGQAVMTAAFVDDVLSLILFSILFNLGDDMKFVTFLPLILGCVFMIIAVVGAVTVWPPFMQWLFSRIPEDSSNQKVTTHDQVMWVLMFVTLVAYAQITHLCGTHLWGCFIAGMCFSTRHHAHHVWVRQVKRITVWFMRIFFACTLAWSIPVSELFSLDAFWKGSIMGIGPCILTKVLCAPFMGNARWVIGWAMVGRAEFAYFIAIMAKALKMMDEKLFAIIIWALIYATIFAPLIFSRVLASYMSQLKGGNDEAEKKREGSPSSLRVSGKVNAASAHLPDMEAEQEKALEQQRKERIGQLEHDNAMKDSDIEQLQASVKHLQAKVDDLSMQAEQRVAAKEEV
jgi:Kef-type K+ transport system membrane component KefB